MQSLFFCYESGNEIVDKKKSCIYCLEMSMATPYNIIRNRKCINVRENNRKDYCRQEYIRCMLLLWR